MLVIISFFEFLSVLVYWLLLFLYVAFLSLVSMGVLGVVRVRDSIYLLIFHNANIIPSFSFMLQKLFSLIDQTSVPDNPDALQYQEVLLPGHLITIYLKVQILQLLSLGTMYVQKLCDIYACYYHKFMVSCHLRSEFNHLSNMPYACILEIEFGYQSFFLSHFTLFF